MTQYQRSYKTARALKMIPQSDCEVSDIDDDASADVDSQIEDHVSDTMKKNQMTVHIVHPG